MFRPVHLSRSLGLGWAFARQQLRQISERLGLGPLAIRAFLPREACRRLDRELKQLETLVRRILFLAAMDRPLPALRPRRARPAPNVPQELEEQAEAPPEAPPEPPLFPVPAFRLTESTPTHQATPHRPQNLLARRLHARDPEARPRPDDLLPSAPLFNRLAALQGALADPEGEVARFRRKLARIRADKALPLPVADTPPAACTGPDVPPVWRELFWTLHDAALSWLPVLDSG